MVHLFGHMNHSIQASEGVHCISNAHDPCDSFGPSTYAVELEDDAWVVELVAHGQYDDSDDDKGKNRKNETTLRPFADMTLRNCKDGDH